MGVIYKATDKVTGKSYIGQTVDFQRRQHDHYTCKEKYAFGTEYQKRPQDFVWEILEECPYEKLNEREIYWIAYYDSYNNGYNMTQGGENADGLLEWQAANPDKVLANAMNGLKYAQAYHQAHPEEHLAQLAKARIKAKQACSKRVRCVELNLEFDSLADAERWSQSSQNPNGKTAMHQHIAHVCRGARKTTGGYHWEYIE